MRKVVIPALIIFQIMCHSCGKKPMDPINGNPVIVMLTAFTDSVEFNKTSLIVCIANDPDNDILTYSWESTGGSIIGSGASILWKAPNTVGTFTVSCSIEDGNGGQAIKATSLIVVAPLGLVAYYPFDGNADDKSGNNNLGIVNGATLAHDRNNNPNSAYSFDGVDDYIDIGNPTVLQIGGEITLSAWVNYNEFDSFSGIISKGLMYNGTEWQGAYALGVAQNNKKAFFEVKTELSNRRFIRSDFVLSTNIWYFIAGTFTPGDALRIYVDGQLEGVLNVVDSQIFHTTTWNNNDIRIGDSQQSLIHPTRFPGFLNGRIDDVRIYNRALSEKEIVDIFQE